MKRVAPFFFLLRCRFEVEVGLKKMALSKFHASCYKPLTKHILMYGFIIYRLLLMRKVWGISITGGDSGEDRKTVANVLINPLKKWESETFKAIIKKQKLPLLSFNWTGRISSNIPKSLPKKINLPNGKMACRFLSGLVPRILKSP